MIEKCVRIANGFDCILDTWMSDKATVEVCGGCPRFSELDPKGEGVSE